MSLSINLNSAAMNASRYLQETNSSLGMSIARLSSGYKINNASDDPAGLVISQNLRAKISGMTQAISNSQDAVNLVKTAEGGLNQVNALLNSMRDLAVHAANVGFNSPDAVAADQSQVASAIASLDTIAQNTAFGDQKLLNGTGATSVSVLDTAKASAITTASSGSVFAGKSGYVDMTVTTAATKAQRVGQAYASAATVLTAATTVGLNGVNIGTFAVTNTLQDVIDAVNAKTAQTGVVASYTGGKFQLDQQKFGSNQQIVLSDSGGSLGGSAVASGLDAVATVTLHDPGGDVVTTFNKGKGNVLADAAGDTINLVGAGTTGTNIAKVSGSALSFQIGQDAGQTTSVSINSTATTNLGTGTGTSFTSISVVDVTVNAQDAIKVLDAAIKQVSNERANLGSFQKNVLESNISSLGVAKENVAASESSIRNTDMATEMTTFARLQIMEQAGTAMLTQANQIPQQLLSLLKG